MTAQRTGERGAGGTHSRQGYVADTPRVSLVAIGLLVAGSAAGVFLAGGPQQGSLGIFLVCAGLALTFCAPRVRVEWPLWMSAAALIGCGALAFVPESFATIPFWRRRLEADPVIHLPASITVLPAETGFWLAILTLTLLVGLFLLSHPIRSHWLLVFALLAAAIIGIYGALAIYARETGWHYAFAADTSFGFFPNRNHTATLLVVGSLLAVGVLGVVLRAGRWLEGVLAAAIVTVCVVALGFFSSSRGGVLFLLIGLVIWLAGLGRRYWDARLLVSLLSLLVAGGILFLVSGGEVRNRLIGKPKTDPIASNTVSAVGSPLLAPAPGAKDALHNLSADLRLKIYRDTIGVVRDFPLTGTGLGTFERVFPQYRAASLSEYTALHPESDWLMLAAEAGIPAVLCTVALCALLLRRLRLERDHLYWPLRWGCVVAAGAAAMHGAVDVPLHRVALGWWVLVLAGLAFQSVRFSGVSRSRFQHGIFVAGGVAALALGALLIRAEWFGGPALPPFVVEEAPRHIFDAYQRKDYSGATALARKAIAADPLFAPAYFQLGVLLAISDAEGTDAKVDAMFSAQRLLDPASPTVPFQQGNIWAGYDPARQTALWMEALGRDARIDAARGSSGLAGPLAYYRELVRQAGGQPDLQRYLLQVVRPDARFEAAWASAALASSAAFAGTLRADAAARPAIVRNWYERGVSEWPPTPAEEPGDWDLASWPVRLRQLVYAGHFEEAVVALTGRYSVSLILPDETASAGALEEAAPPVLTFESAWRNGDTAAARRTLDGAIVNADDPASLELWRWRAAVAAHDGNWPAAWEALDTYIRHTRQTEWP